MFTRLVLSALLLASFVSHPANAGNYSCTSGTEVILMIGESDNFVSPYETTYPDANLVAFISTLGIPIVPLDHPSIDAARAHTFIWTEQGLCDAELTAHVRALGGLSENDRFNLEFRDEWLVGGGEVFRWTLPLADLTNTFWGDGDEATLVLHLSDLPVDLYGRATVLLYMIDGNLDVMVQDDTNVDYLILRLCVWCPVPAEEHTWGQIKVLYAE